MCPDVDDLVITFVIGDKAHVVIVNYFINFSHGIFDEGLFNLWNNHIIEVKGEASLECHGETKVFDVVKELGCFSCSSFLQDGADDITKSFLRQ